MPALRTLRLLPLALLPPACGGPSLSEPVPEDRVIAGVIDDEAALFGGSASEGRLGDVLIQNSRVRFVIQGARDDGHYYESAGGGIIDADIARPDGQAGRDPVDEWMGMFGLGRISRATEVEVLDRGWRSEEAVVRVTAEEVPLTLFTGTVENPDVVPDLGLTVVTDYVLRPDTPLLEVISTVTVGEEEAELAPGDVLQGGLETVYPWDPVVGLEAPGEDQRRFTAYVGRHNEGAWAIVPEPGQTATLGGDGQLLAEIGDLITTFREPENVPAGGVITYRRFYAVGPDVAAITDAVLALDETPSTTVSGSVSAGGGPVAGARVHVYADDALFTVAFTDEGGTFSADVPAGAAITYRASGMLDGLTLDMDPARGPTGPYTRADDAAGSVVIPAAEGFGLGPVSDSPDLVLDPPARLTVTASDGAPFEVRVTGPRPDLDATLVDSPPDGTLAMGWAVDGEVTLPVPVGAEPSELTVEVHRGLRFERVSQSLTLSPGEASTLEVSLEPAVAPAGWLVVDPHSHASPSGDGQVSMEERLIGSAARGIQLHVGTDHDHVADYRPLVGALGLSAHLRSIVGNEVSPPLRGHLNAYPLTHDPSAPNGGAIRWWVELPETTDALVARFDEMGDDVLVQANHPFDNGIGGSARWRPGAIRSPDKWTDRFELMEVNNAGETAENLEIYFDLITRGHRITPVGVSDAHGYTSGGLGLNVTFVDVDSDLDGYTDAALVEAMRAGRTVVSRGAFLDLSIPPGSTVSGTQTLTVTASSASWAPIDRLRLLRDGEEVAVEEGPTATFELEPEADAVYVVIAEGDTALGGPYGGTTAWAMAAPIYVDVAGDGWEAPKPPLEK